MKDTEKLLKECDAGLSMAVDSLERALEGAEAQNFMDMLNKYYKEHKDLKMKIDDKLKDYDLEKEAPNAPARIGSKVMTNMKLAFDESDKKIADIMMDGCNMGIKSVSRYMNQYKDSKEDIMQLSNDIVTLEQKFMNDLRQYL